MAASGAAKPLNHETLSLMEEARAFFDNVIPIDPACVTFQFERGHKRPRVIINDTTDISSLSCLLVRGTTGYNNSIALLAHTLYNLGCVLVDPLERFTLTGPSKLLTTLRRHTLSVGTSSYLAFTAAQARYLIQKLAEVYAFPLLAKPIDGRQGKDVVVFYSEADAQSYVTTFFEESDRSSEKPLFLQRYVDFVAEYRVMLVGGRCLGVVQKIPAKGQLVSNAAAGGVFSRVDNSLIEDFLAANVAHNAILGVDVGEDTAGEKHIIEENYAPLWRQFEEATDVNVAREIVRYARERCLAISDG